MAYGAMLICGIIGVVHPNFFKAKDCNPIKFSSAIAIALAIIVILYDAITKIVKAYQAK
ncbi:MAG: hypothetical protein OEY79_02580 [Anaplasmataceae bacterium]|nr:hypothetical protein [Anaplasmataceae bacterium]